MKLNKKDILSIPHMQAFAFNTVKALSITGVSIDSRTIKSGELFVAIRGEQFDGHNFISKAVEANAGVLIVEKRWADMNATMTVSLNIPILVVEDTIRAYGALAKIYRNKFDIPVLAVGGSNGKTTTKEMIKNVLAAKYNVLCTEGNLNNNIGVPQTLFRLEKKHTFVVLEIGTNHPGEIRSLCEIAEPTHGLITNIGREHLEFFGTLDGVANAEVELFEWLSAHKGIGFVNGDDDRIRMSAKKLVKPFTYGFTARNTSAKGSGLIVKENACAEFSVKPKAKRPFSISLHVPGQHNAKNALAASAVGLAFKVSQKDIQSALMEFSAASKRMQVLKIHGLTIFNDSYNSNPDSALAALKTLQAIHGKGKKIAVLADMRELGDQAPELHRHIGEEAGKSGIDVLLTHGTLSRNTHEAALVPAKYHFEQKSALVEFLLQTVASGDVVLIKGSRGMKMEDVVNALTERFS